MGDEERMKDQMVQILKDFGETTPSSSALSCFRISQTFSTPIPLTS